MNFDTLLQQAALLFQEAQGCAAIFSDPVVIKDWRRSLTIRCRVKSAEAGISTIILKQIREEPVLGFSDWAGLAFLSCLPGTHGIVPRFLGGDASNRFFLIEDLGAGQNLQDILVSADAGAIHEALQAMAVQMARLHAATREKQEMFQDIRGALPETDGLGRETEARRWLDNRGKIMNWFEALGLQAPPGLAQCMEHIAAVYREPGEFLAFTHGDPAPSNNHFANGQARLLDFEYGGFRHALYDITAWNIMCPLPLDCVSEMRRCFRQELAETYPAARDEALFAEAWACICAYRTLAILTWMPPVILGQNRPWVDNWTMREAVFVAVSRLEQITAPFTELGAVNEAARILSNAMRDRWPGFDDAETMLPQWSKTPPAKIFG